MQNDIHPELIQVLWVENDPVVTKAYPTEAADHDIQLVPFSCWEKAYAELQTNHKRWAAIILDAKCQVKETDSDNATRFLMRAITDITSLGVKFNREIPWYVLSGELGDEDAADLLNFDRPWDSDWPNKYYAKTTDRDILYRRIKYHTTQTKYLQVLNTYSEVFNALRDVKVNPECENLMEDLLLYIQDPVANTDNHSMLKLRKVLEHLFISMIHNGLIPNDADHLSKKGSPNLNYCSLWLAGKEVAKKDGTIVVPAPPKAYVTDIMSENIKNIIHVAGAEVHVQDETMLREDTKNTDLYLQSVGNSTYLLRSLVFQLCDIILWYYKYITR